MKAELIITKRLTIKTLRKSHVTASYVNGLNDPEVNLYLDHGQVRKKTRESVIDYVEKNFDSKTDVLFGLFLKNALIGTIRVHGISFYHYNCEIGVCIFNKKCWGKGYAAEAMSGVVQHLFDKLNIHCITAGAYCENKASIELFKRVGFHIMAHLKKRWRHLDRFEDTVILGIINKNFDMNLLS